MLTIVRNRGQAAVRVPPTLVTERDRAAGRRRCHGPFKAARSTACTCDCKPDALVLKLFRAQGRSRGHTHPADMSDAERARLRRECHGVLRASRSGECYCDQGLFDSAQARNAYIARRRLGQIDEE